MSNILTKEFNILPKVHPIVYFIAGVLGIMYTSYLILATGDYLIGYALWYKLSISSGFTVWAYYKLVVYIRAKR